MPPRFSVVIPSFQSEKTIADAISSLQTQDFGDWEALIVDDGSTDQTAEIVKRFQEADPRISYFYEPINRGPGAPSNYGINKAQGEYVLFLHADDEFISGSLAELDSEIGDDTPDLVFFGVEGRRRGRHRLLHDESFANRPSLRGRLTNVREAPGLVMWPPAAWTKTYRRIFILHGGFRFPDGTYEDIPWSMETAVAAETILVAHTTVYRYITRETGSSITTSQNVKSLDRVLQVARARENVLKLPLSERTVQHLSALAAVHLVWAVGASYRTIPEQLQDEFFGQCAAELSKWPISGALDTRVKSEPLLKTKERVVLAKALLSGSQEKWKKARSNFNRNRRWRKFLRLSTA